MFVAICGVSIHSLPTQVIETQNEPNSVWQTQKRTKRKKDGMQNKSRRDSKTNEL